MRMRSRPARFARYSAASARPRAVPGVVPGCTRAIPAENVTVGSMRDPRGPDRCEALSDLLGFDVGEDQDELLHLRDTDVAGRFGGGLASSYLFRVCATAHWRLRTKPLRAVLPRRCP